MTTAASKTGEYAGKKAGDKKVQMLSKSHEKKIPKKSLLILLLREFQLRAWLIKK